MAHKLATSAHFKRFEKFDYFPRVFSGTRKLHVNVEFFKGSGRDRKIEGTIQNKPPFYDVSYNQVLKHPQGILIASNPFKSQKEREEEEYNSLMLQGGIKVSHKMFKPKFSFKNDQPSSTRMARNKRFMMLEES